MADMGWMSAIPDAAPHPATVSAAGAATQSNGAAGEFVSGNEGDWMAAIPDAAPQHIAPDQKGAPGGMARNIAAGLVDAGGALVNTLSDPFGNLVGKPLATGIQFAHDALAPVFGYERFPADVREKLLGDTVPQPGTKAMTAIAHGLGATPPEEVQPSTDMQSLVRRGVTNATLLGGMGPMAAFSGAAAPIGGDVAASAVTDWAKPAAELGGQMAAGATPSVAKTTLGVIASPVTSAARRVVPVALGSARERSVGRVLDRIVGGSTVENSPVGPLNLAQATNNPEVAARVDLAPSFNAGAKSSLDAAQQQAIQAQIGKIGAPATRSDASSAFTTSLREGRKVAGSEENRLWTVPKLAELPVTPDPVRGAVNEAVGAMDPVLRDSMPPRLRALVNRLNNAKDTTVRDLNGIRSDLEQVARTSNDGAERSMARTISDSFMKGMDQVPEIVGIPAVNTTASTETHFIPGVGDVPVQIGATAKPGTSPDPEIASAYQSARDYTRQMRTMFGAPDPSSLLARNAAGVPRVDASEGARRFFNFSNGSPEGPKSIAQLADFIDTLKAQPMAPKIAGQMRDSARSFVASALTDAARANEGQNFNPKTMQDFLRDNGPWIKSSGLFEKPQIDAATDLMSYADMLRRPEQLLRQSNSMTQPRAAREATFIDQVMSPWVRHLAAVVPLVGGAHQHGFLGGAIGTVLGGGFEHVVTGAETAMRDLMAQALMDPQVAQALRMKASAANRVMMPPVARQAIDAARGGVEAAITASQDQRRQPVRVGDAQ